MAREGCDHGPDAEARYLRDLAAGMASSADCRHAGLWRRKDPRRATFPACRGRPEIGRGRDRNFPRLLRELDAVAPPPRAAAAWLTDSETYLAKAWARWPRREH